MVKGFPKMYILSFLLQTFLLFNWIFQNKFQFLQICNFFADSKSKVQELSNDVSSVIFGHQTWDLEGGGGQIDLPPQHILVFSGTPAGIGLIEDSKSTFKIVLDLTLSFKTSTLNAT